MQFFTPEWHRGELPEADAEAIVPAYQRHVERLLPNLSTPMRVLAAGLGLHDALIRRVVLDRAARELRLELRGGDQQLGYFDLDLTYLGAIVDAADVATLAAAARAERTGERAEVLYDEVDLVIGSPGRYLHRLLFSSYREAEVLFDALALRLAPRANREIPVVSDRFVEVGATAG
jgi:hypothetical protein